MVYPTMYSVTYSYTGFQASQGNNSFPGTQIDADLQGLRSSVSNLALFTQGVMRSDGALQNGVVTFDSLSSGLQTAGLTPATPWLTATFYAVGKNVIQGNNNLYRALVAHTSGVFATDLAAGNWVLVATLAQIPLPSVGALGGAFSKAVTTNRFLTGLGTDGHLIDGRPDAVDVTFTAAGGTQRSLDARLKDFYNIKDYGAVGDGVTDDAPAFRAAIDLLPAGSTIRVPQGKYLMNSARNGAVIDLTGANAGKGISIIGDGWNVVYNGAWTASVGSTVFLLGASITGATDFIHLSGSGTLGTIGMQFRDFLLTTTSGIYAGAVGRHGIFFDGSLSDHFFVENVIMDNLFIDNMATGYSICASAAATSINGILLVSTISRCFLMSVRLVNSADAITIEENTFGQNATNDSRNQGVYISAVSGATTDRIINNYFLNFNGMVVIDGGPDPIIQNNVFEQSAANAYGSMVDLNGAVLPLTGGNVSGNRFSQLIAGSTAIPLRINAATNISVAGNWFFLAAVYPFIAVTAHAVSTVIGDNYYQDSAGYKVNGSISDAGIATKYDTPLYSWRAATNVPGIPAAGKMFSWYDAANLRFHDIDTNGNVGTTVIASTAAAHEFATGIGSNGVIAYGQPALADLTSGAWTAYTPTITAQAGTITGATITTTGRYQQIGKTVIVEMDITLTNIGSGSPTSSLLASLPLTAAAFRYTGSVYEYTVTAKSGAGFIAPSGTTLSTRDASGMSWFVNGYSLVCTAVYEVP